MKKLLSTVSLSMLSVTTLATDFQATGARYAAQGGAMVSAANDSFALTVNPANLVLHSDEEAVAEFTANFVQVENEALYHVDDLNMVGGFYASEHFAAGLFIGGAPGATEYQASEADNRLGLETSQVAYALAFGDSLGENGAFTYSVGAILHSLQTDQDSSKGRFEGSGTTFSTALTGTHDVVFHERTWSLKATFGAAYSQEIEAANKDQSYSLKPQVKRAGITAEIAHLATDVSFNIALTAEHLVIESSAPSLIPQLQNGEETRVGAELTFLQPFNTDSNFSLRIGQRRSENASLQSLSSAGLGLTIEKWSVDVAISEEGWLTPTRVYNLSVTYSF